MPNYNDTKQYINMDEESSLVISPTATMVAIPAASHEIGTSPMAQQVAPDSSEAKAEQPETEQRSPKKFPFGTTGIDLTEFTCFPQLPIELRMMVWENAERDPRMFTTKHLFDIPASKIKTTVPSPALLSTCHEARRCQLALEKKSVPLHTRGKHRRWPEKYEMFLANFESDVDFRLYESPSRGSRLFLSMNIDNYLRTVESLLRNGPYPRWQLPAKATDSVVKHVCFMNDTRDFDEVIRALQSFLVVESITLTTHTRWPTDKQQIAQKTIQLWQRFRTQWNGCLWSKTRQAPQLVVIPKKKMLQMRESGDGRYLHELRKQIYG